MKIKEEVTTGAIPLGNPSVYPDLPGASILKKMVRRFKTAAMNTKKRLKKKVKRRNGHNN